MNTDFFDFLYLRVFHGDRRMGFFPSVFEDLEFPAVNLASILHLIVFLDLGNSFELLDDLLVVTSALSCCSIVEVFLEGFEDLGGSR